MFKSARVQQALIKILQDVVCTGKDESINIPWTWYHIYITYTIV